MIYCNLVFFFFGICCSLAKDSRCAFHAINRKMIQMIPCTVMWMTSPPLPHTGEHWVQLHHYLLTGETTSTVQNASFNWISVNVQLFFDPETFCFVLHESFFVIFVFTYEGG